MTPLRMAYLSALVGGVGFFVVSVAWLGVWPARVLEEQARAHGPEPPLALTASELRGRAIYAREGCAYCHTQQVRFTEADEARFGAPTLAWESRRDYPHMLGTRRIGPDLSRAAGTRSEDWHLVHLFAPRDVVPESVMPSYRHLFNGAATEPRQEARDLVAYLDSLGRARALATTADVAVHPASTRRTGRVPEIPDTGDAVLGARLYRTHCASCHGADGRGDGPAAAALRPRPPDLSGFYKHARLAQVLWHGVPGTAMPAWRDRSPAELAALAAHVQQIGAPKSDRTSGTPEQLALGARVYAANCAQCHGEIGAGDGWAASQLAVPPTNFQLQMGARAPEAIRNGIEGTMMAAWSTRLSSDEIDAVSSFIREFYRR